MRALLGLALLGTLFLLAAGWQQRLTRRLRGERHQRYGVPLAADRSSGEFARLVLGRPSGAEALPTPVDVTQDPGVEEELEFRWEQAPYQPDYQYEVQPGDILGRICQRHYGSARPEIIDAVAAYNDLARPDAITEGQILLLPDEELLLGQQDG